MSHPFDDKDLTFGDLKKIITLGLSGQLNREDNVTEKTDGQNLMVSWKDGKLIAARNKGHLKNKGETALDIVSYAAHMAALIGAHIIKVKPPTSFIEQDEAKKVYLSENIPISSLNERIKHVVQSCFNGKRLLVFSGGTSKDKESHLGEVKELYLGGASGSIIGRNCFQRPYSEAVTLLNQIIDIYKGKWFES